MMKIQTHKIGVRILPPLIVAMAALFVVKVIATGDALSDALAAAPAAPAQAAPAQPAPAAPQPAAPQTAGQSLASSGSPAPASAQTSCPGPSLAEQAGLSAAEIQVLTSLGDRRKALETRARDIDTREQLLAAAEKRVNERIAELKALDGKVQAAVARLDTARSADLVALSNMYQRMKPKDAARVFETLDAAILLDIASGMKEPALASILGAMAPVEAKKLTEMLARRNAQVDTVGSPSAPASSARSAGG